MNILQVLVAALCGVSACALASHNQSVNYVQGISLPVQSLSRYTPPSTLVDRWIPIRVETSRIVSIGPYPLVVPLCVPGNIRTARMAYVHACDRNGRAIYYAVYFGPDYKVAAAWAKTAPHNIFSSIENVKVKRITLHGPTDGSPWTVGFVAEVNGKLTHCIWRPVLHSETNISGDPFDNQIHSPRDKKYVMLTVVTIPESI